MSSVAARVDNIESVNHPPVVNVVGLNNDGAGIEIMNFLNDKKRKSENTYKNYIRYYKEFCMFNFNKQINEITWNDIFNYTYKNTLRFKAFLLNKGDSPNFVNQKLFSVKALWKRLYSLDHRIDMTVWDFEEEDFEENNYAAFNNKEIKMLYEYAENYPGKSPKTRRMFFEFLFTVGCRKSVARGTGDKGIKWSDITKKQDGKSGLYVWVVRFYDKGKWVEKSIHDDFYNKLAQLKGTESKGDLVFDLHISTLEETFDNFKKEYNLETKNGRTVCIHSIKKATGRYVQNTFGDMNKTRKHLQHKSVEMTKTYIDDEDYTEQASYLIGKEVGMDAFENLDKETLLKLIAKCEEVHLKMFYELEKMSK